MSTTCQLNKGGDYKIPNLEKHSPVLPKAPAHCAHQVQNALSLYCKELTFSMGQRRGGLPGAQTVKSLPAVQEAGVPSLGGEVTLEKETAPLSSILAWGIAWMGEPGGL